MDMVMRGLYKNGHVSRAMQQVVVGGGRMDRGLHCE
jgi:hypothetical protein